MSEEGNEELERRARRFAEVVKEELLRDEQFWEKVREQAGEGWFKRYKKAYDDLEVD